MRKTIDSEVRKALKETIFFGNGAYGLTRPISSKDRVTKKELMESIRLLEKNENKYRKLTYFPDWGYKYPMWINNILFWLFNNISFLRRFERYL